jgi:hypothetical protein
MAAIPINPKKRSIYFCLEVKHQQIKNNFSDAYFNVFEKRCESLKTFKTLKNKFSIDDLQSVLPLAYHCLLLPK